MLPAAVPLSFLPTRTMACGAFFQACGTKRSSLAAPTFGGFLEGALEATEHAYTVLKTGRGRSEKRL